MKLYAISVATHKEGYYDAFMESCRRNGIDLVILGYGQPWQGFAWRFLLMKDYLEKLDDQDIVVFLDAYDMLATQTASTILARFLEFQSPLVIGTENIVYTNLFSRYIRNSMFGYCPKADVSGGAYMGYVYALKKMYTIICDSFHCHSPEFSNLDDQRILTSLCNNDTFVDRYVKYDYDHFIFYTLTLPVSILQLFLDHTFHPDPIQHTIQNKTLYLTYTNTSPCFIHGIVNANMDYLINLYNLPMRQNTRSYYLFERILYYCFTLKYEILFLFLICGVGNFMFQFLCRRPKKV